MHHPHEDADISTMTNPSGSDQALAGITRVFQRCPGDFQKQPFLWVHAPRFTGGNAEEQRIELIDAVQETTPLTVGSVAAFTAGVKPVPPIPALRGYFTNAVPPLAQLFPEPG